MRVIHFAGRFLFVRCAIYMMCVEATKAEVFPWSKRLLTFSFDRRKRLLKTRQVVALHTVARNGAVCL